MASNSSALDGIYLHRVVKALVPPGTSDERSDALYEELLDFSTSKHFKRYPSSDLASSLSHAQAMVDDTQFDQLQRSVEHLLKFRDPSDISRVLGYLISVIQGQRPQQLEGISQRKRTHSSYDQGDRLSVYNDNKSMSNYATTVASFENDNFDMRSVYSMTQASGPRSSTLEQLIIPYLENQVPESEIINYICYTLAGTTSAVLPLKEGEVVIPESISNGLSGMLHLILEVGLIYQRLTNLVDHFKSSRNTSQTKVAFVSFISGELDQYVQLVNSLSMQSDMTLKSIYCAIYDWLVKLRFLHSAWNSTHALPSYQLLSSLHAFTLHGDPLLQECAQSIFEYVLEPFFSSLTSWIVNGELGEAADELFITYAPTSDAHNTVGSATFLPERVPVFVPVNLAQQIFVIGVTNSFLKMDCKETEWVNQFSQKSDFLLQQLKKREKFSLGDSSFHKVIHSLYDEILNFFTHTIYSKYHMDEVLRALCDYLLMAKGDFIESIIARGASLLSEPSSSLTGHQLTGLLQDSVLRTTSRYDLMKKSGDVEGSVILNKLDARLLAVGHGNIGWDVFTLDYRVDGPFLYLLNNSNNDHKREYLRVFNHLWKIKRLGYMFAEGWKQGRTSRNLRNKRMRRVMLIHNFIDGLLKTIENYLLLEIIDVSRTSLFSKLNKTSEIEAIAVSSTSSSLKVASAALKPSTEFLKRVSRTDDGFQKFEHQFKELPINEIQEIHEKFLNSITHHRLLDGSGTTAKSNLSGKSYIGQMNTLIDIAFKFVLSETEFHQLSLELTTIGLNQFIKETTESRFKTIYNNLMSFFGDFNTSLKTFVGDLSYDDDTKLRQLGLSLKQ